MANIMPAIIAVPTTARKVRLIAGDAWDTGKGFARRCSQRTDSCQPTAIW
jgi:hypothetical protein